jgi:dipeptidase E
VKLLLTSGGITNASIHRALVGMLDKPTSECAALCMPTAGWGHPMDTPAGAWRFITGKGGNPMTELGGKSMGVLELTALPGIAQERWQRWVADADVLLVNGGDALYLAYWMRQSGLADFLQAQPAKAWVGLSAGSMVMAPRVGDDFIQAKPPLTGEDRALGVVDFAIFPHLDYPTFPENTMACAERWAATLGCPSYAIDDQTAIKVVDGKVEVVSEGHWRHFPG